MPAPATVAEYLDMTRKSGLVPDDRLKAAVAKLRAGPDPVSTVDQMAAGLVREAVLTRFQAKQLKLGKYKRFDIAGKYRLLELLGVGGMGAVYLCEHTFMKRLVALKVLPVDKLEDQSALLRFYREARAVAALDDPNVVRAYDIDKFEQLHFLVMEYVDGASLQEVVARHGPLDPVRAAHYIAQAARGLHHAHQLGMVHRDVKPGNLLLDRTGVVKILDMGLARFFDHTHDNVTERFDNNCVLGTADYLAPEQAVSNVVDIRADIYALGGSLYFMLTGQSPFPDGTVAAKLVAHQTQEPKPVAAFRADVPADLLAVLHKMMAKNPADRYQTPAEVHDALAAWADAPVGPPPAHEMPDLSPAVLALAGYTGDRARAGSLKLPAAAGARTGVHPALGGPPSSRPGLGRADTPPVQALQPTAATTGSPTEPIRAGAPAAASSVDLRRDAESQKVTKRVVVRPADRWQVVAGVLGGLAAAAGAATSVVLLLR